MTEISGKIPKIANFGSASLEKPVSSWKGDTKEMQAAIPIIQHSGIETSEVSPTSSFNHKAIPLNQHTAFFMSLTASFFQEFVERSKKELEYQITVERRDTESRQYCANVKEYWADIQEKFHIEVEKLKS